MDVVGVGYPVQDLLLRMEKIPTAGTASTVLGTSWQGGGMVSTGLAAAAVLGASAGMIGKVGDDVFGRMLKRDFEANGVDTSR